MTTFQLLIAVAWPSCVQVCQPVLGFAVQGAVGAGTLHVVGLGSVLKDSPGVTRDLLICCVTSRREILHGLLHDRTSIQPTRSDTAYPNAQAACT